MELVCVKMALAINASVFFQSALSHEDVLYFLQDMSQGLILDGLMLIIAVTKGVVVMKVFKRRRCHSKLSSAGNMDVT